MCLSTAHCATFRVVQGASHAQQLLLFNLLGIGSKLDWLSCGPSAEVVHASLQTLLPGVEVHAGELGSGGSGNVHVEGLRLADVGTTVGGHIDQSLSDQSARRREQKNTNLLGDLPHRFVASLDILGEDGHVLNGTLVEDQVLLHVLVPDTQINQLLQEVLVDDLEFAREYAAGVDVAREGLNGFIVSKDLGSACSGHRCQQQRVASAVLHHVGTEFVPVPHVGGRDAPQVWLEFTFTQLCQVLGPYSAATIHSPVSLGSSHRHLAWRRARWMLP